MLHDQGHQDLAEYIDAHPEFVARALHLATVVEDVNETTVRLFEAKSREELLGPLDVTFDTGRASRLRTGGDCPELNMASSMTSKTTVLSRTGRATANVIMHFYVPART